MYYNWNRYYDPETGRYITSDPIGLLGGINSYNYVEGNPANWFDSEGLEVQGRWIVKPHLSDINFSINGVGAASSTIMVKVEGRGTASIDFGVECWDDEECEDDRWTKSLSLSVSASGSAQVPIPGICKIVLKGSLGPLPGWVRERYYKRLVWSCRLGVAIKIAEARRILRPDLAKKVYSEATPIISSLPENGPEAICKMSGR